MSETSGAGGGAPDTGAANLHGGPGVDNSPSVDGSPGVRGRRDIALKIAGVCGAVVGYGCLAAFLYLISLQIYRWFRQGEWTHFGVSEAIRVGLSRCCVNDTDSGRLAALVHWLDSPVDWLGLHKMLEVLPASLALFLVSMLGNSIFIYCRDRIGESDGS